MKKKVIPKENKIAKENKKREYDLSFNDKLLELFRETSNAEDVNHHIALHLAKIQKKYKFENYAMVMLYDEVYDISSWHSNRIYEAISSVKKEKDIFLLIHSGGGQIEPAYLASKACKSLCKDKFIVAVPRKAKSAATLISLGADEIHLGQMSELGPIDPQFSGYPALSLSNALQTLAKLCTKYPDSANMFALYLTKTLNLKDLGYFERVNESATQYAERLLMNKTFEGKHTPNSLADHFVNHYKDHGFAIDFDEAKKLLGKNMVKKQTDEYLFADEIYKFLDLAKFLYDIKFVKKLSYVGSLENGIYLTDKK